MSDFESGSEGSEAEDKSVDASASSKIRQGALTRGQKTVRSVQRMYGSVFYFILQSTRSLLGTVAPGLAIISLTMRLW